MLSRSWLARSLAEVGEFPDAIPMAEEALRIARSTESPFAEASACLGVGTVLVARGAFAGALAPLERGLDLCELRELYGLFPAIASYLAYAYALCGRFAAAWRSWNDWRKGRTRWG